MSENFREEAEEHWKFVEGLVIKMITGYWTEVTMDKKVLEIFKYLYVEGMVHGYKHGTEEGRED